MLYCRWIHVPLFLSSSWKLVMQSALFCGTLPLAETPFKKFPFSSDFSFHPFQALFTRPAPLTSSSPSYHSSVGGEAGFRELRKGRGDLTNRQSNLNCETDVFLRHCLLRQESRKERPITHTSCSTTWSHKVVQWCYHTWLWSIHYKKLFKTPILLKHK